MTTENHVTRKHKPYSKIQELRDKVECLQRAQAHTRGQIEENQNQVLQKLSVLEQECKLITRITRENHNLEVLEN